MRQRGVAQQHDVAGHALHGEVFIHGADHGAFRLSYHGEQSGLRNGAAAGDGRQARASSRPQLWFTRSRWRYAPYASAAGGNAFGEHFENAVEVRAIRLR